MHVRAVAFKKEGVVQLHYKKGGFFIFFLAIVLLIAGCSAENKLDSGAADNSITADAVSKIYRACKYPNDDFCEESCCIAAEKCNGEVAYRECDLGTGEWKGGIFSDSECSSGCEAMESDTKEQKQIALKACNEGWKCINKFERAYRNDDCSFGEVERCNSGCVNDTCANLCTPGTFSCRNDILRKCDEDGSDWRYYSACDYGCENNTCIGSTNSSQTQNTTQSQNICDDSCFSVTNFHYDAEGNDNNNENDEYVTIKNSCSFSCNLEGWEISDDSSHKYSFASFNLGNGNSFTLYTGEGTDTESRLYWNRGSAVWNNDGGDTLYLKNQSGETIFSHSYS